MRQITSDETAAIYEVSCKLNELDDIYAVLYHILHVLNEILEVVHGSDEA